MMRHIKVNVFVPFVLLLFMLIDGQISTLLSTYFPSECHVVAHMLFMGVLFASVHVSQMVLFLNVMLIGFLYDSYYFHVLGIAVLIFPVISLFVSEFNSTMMFNRFTRMLSLLLLVLAFELISFIFAQMIHVTSMSLGAFIVYSLMPSLFFNMILGLILQPIFEKTMM